MVRYYCYILHATSVVSVTYSPHNHQQNGSCMSNTIIMSNRIIMSNTMFLYLYCFKEMLDVNHEQLSVSSEESDEEMVFEDWRTNKFLRENYLDSIRVICISLN